MILTKNSNKKKNINTNFSNKEYKYKNIEDINNKINNIDEKIKEINMKMNKKEEDLKNIINENESKEKQEFLKEIKTVFLNYNKKLDDIINKFDNELKYNKELKKNNCELIDKNGLLKIETSSCVNIFKVERKKNIIENIDSICFIPKKNEYTPELIDTIFIPMLDIRENGIEEFGKLKKLKEKTIKNGMKYIPFIKKNINYKIKREEEFEIICNLMKEDFKKKIYKKNALPIIKKSKPLVHQLINNLFIPSKSNIEKEIIENEEKELLRIYIPIQDFTIEEKDSIELKPLTLSLIVQNNIKIKL